MGNVSLSHLPAEKQITSIEASRYERQGRFIRENAGKAGGGRASQLGRDF
jgi:hypothetical protein